MATDHPPIGDRIRRARERLRMSQQELADRLRVSRGAVNSWERNRTYPQSSIGALEDILGIRLTDGEGPDPDPVNPEPELSVEELAEQMAQLTEQMTRLARRYREQQNKGEADGSYRRRAG